MSTATFRRMILVLVLLGLLPTACAAPAQGFAPKAMDTARPTSQPTVTPAATPTPTAAPNAAVIPPLFLIIRANSMIDGPANQGVWRVDAGAAEVERVTPAEAQVTAFAVAAGGRLAYGTKEGKIFQLGGGQDARLLYDAAHGLDYPVAINGLGWSPDGRQLAYTTVYALEERRTNAELAPTGLWLLNVEAGEATQLMRSRYLNADLNNMNELRILSDPSWSPDGAALMLRGNYWEWANVLWLSPVAPDLEGETLREAPGDGGWMSSVWSRDSKSILVGGALMAGISDLARVDRDSAGLTTLVRGEPEQLYVFAPKELPDGGAFVALDVFSSTPGVRVYRFQGQGETATYAPAGPAGSLCPEANVQSAAWNSSGDLVAVACAHGQLRVVSLDGKVDLDLSPALGPLVNDDRRVLLWAQ